MEYVIKSDNPYESEAARMIEKVRKQQVQLMKVPVIDRSKWETCQFCRTKNRIQLGFDGYDDAISIVTDNNAAAIESDSFGFIVGYCPMCGRPLTEQVWQELERRVFGE